MFTKSQSYDSAHQVLGILVLLAIPTQWGMGFWHHRVYKRTQSLTKLGPIHRYLGHAIVFLAIVNGGLGLTWSYASKSVVIGYSIVVAIFAWARMASRRDQAGLIGHSSELRRFQGHDDSDGIDLVQETDRAPDYHYNVYKNYDRL